MPMTPEKRKAFEKARADARRALGLCKTCAAKARPRKTRCQPCATLKR